MRIKQLLYLGVILLGLFDAVVGVMNKFQVDSAMNFQFLEAFDFIGAGLLVFGIVLLKLSFEISLKFELFLLLAGLATHIGIQYQAPHLISGIHAGMAFVIFPLFAMLFYMEYIKDLLLSDLVFTVRGIIVKILIGSTIVFVLMEISMIYHLAIDYTMTSIEVNRFTGVVLVLMMMIYLNKLGFKRSSRQLDEQGFFIEDLRKMAGYKIRNADLMLYALYGMMIFGFLTGRVTFISIYPVMIGGIFFAARGYKNWMFPFVLIGTIGVLAYYTRDVGKVKETADYLVDSGFMYGRMLALGIILPYIYDIINRFGVATFSNSSEQ